ncbi:MAG: retron system putative HNH endonuclease [bacterium]|nr:retron system putative HNH endonuclease [bacterium]
MKHIQKGQEPESFKDWKDLENDDWKPNWDNLSKPQKTDVHDTLLREQGYICCYCGMRINRSSSHIEHLKPRKTYPNLALDYTNLIASCPGEGDERENEKLPLPPPLSEHCGHKKGFWYDPDLMVSPLIENCADYFKYTGFGEILPNDDPTMHPAAKETIERLGLDNLKLEASRRKQIRKILPLIDGLTVEEIQKLAQSYEQLDAEGKYVPFCAAILYILNEYFLPENRNIKENPK